MHKVDIGDPRDGHRWGAR